MKDVLWKTEENMTENQEKLLKDGARLMHGTFDLSAEVVRSDGSRVILFPEECGHFIGNQECRMAEAAGIYIEGELLAYLVLSVPDTAGGWIYLGPVYLRYPMPSEKEALKNKLEQAALSTKGNETKKTNCGNVRQEIREYVDCLPIYPIARLGQILQFCYWSICHQWMEVKELFHIAGDDGSKAHAVVQDGVEMVQTKERLMRREAGKPHNSYYQEMEEYAAVRAGNVNLVKELLKRPISGTPGTLSKDSLRNAKNLFISTVTMLTRTAVDGGVTQEEAYNMSDAFIQQSENSQTIRDVESLRYRAMVDFTERVAEWNSREYSPMIEKSIDYIYNHLHHDIRLSEVADAIPVSASHLSRVFKQEVGMTLTSYVQYKRIDAAKNMLRFSEYSYLEIANYLNFKTQSYFIVVFKRLEGMTPMEYRHQYGGYEMSRRWYH